jgi:hypothetical protein
MPEANIPKIYVDSCAFIDHAKFEARLTLGGSEQQQAERSRDVWRLARLLEASRLNAVRILTSSVAIAECAHVREPSHPVPSAETQRFFSELLTSGRSRVSELLTRDEKIYQGRDKLAVMKLEVRYPGDTSQLSDRSRQEDFHERLTS